jgi:hypothetical protein
MVDLFFDAKKRAVLFAYGTNAVFGSLYLGASGVTDLFQIHARCLAKFLYPGRRSFSSLPAFDGDYVGCHFTGTRIGSGRLIIIATLKNCQSPASITRLQVAKRAWCSRAGNDIVFLTAQVEAMLAFLQAGTGRMTGIPCPS